MPMASSLRANPIQRISLARVAHCAPNTCSTRARTLARVRLPCCSQDVNGLLRVPLR